MSLQEKYEELRDLIQKYYLTVEAHFVEYCQNEALADMSAYSTQLEELFKVLPTKMAEDTLLNINRMLNQHDFTHTFEVMVDHIRKMEELINEKIKELEQM